MTPELKHALSRGAFHALFGLALVVCLLAFPRFPVVVGLAAVTGGYLALDFARIKAPAFRRHFLFLFEPLMRKKENSRLTGSSYFLIGSLVTVLAFSREIAALSILFLSFGDPAATAIGMWKGRVRFRDKSLEGDLACLVICLLAGAAVVKVIGIPPFAIAVIGAVSAAFFQALPLRLNDNLTIPVGSALVMWLALNSVA